MPLRYLTDRPPTRPRIKPQAAKGRPKLSTKCRQLEGKNGFVYSLRRPKAAPVAETKGTLLCYQSNSSASAK